MRYRKSAVSSSQIVQAAIRVLARQGYAGTSLLDIAREAGMSKGAVHYHFPTKEALLSVVLKTACETVQARTLGVFGQGEDLLESFRKAIEVLWEARASRSDEALVVADLLAQSLHDPSLRPQLAEFYRISTEQVEAYLGERLSSLGLEPKVPLSTLSRLVLGILDGLMLQVFVDPDAIGPDQIVDTFLTMAGAFLSPKNFAA
jgi:TetR/AcrR family acrAB operon transcriptional repressor